jgi:HlyD family secretion protein
MSKTTQSSDRVSLLQRARHPKIWVPVAALLAIGGGAFLFAGTNGGRPETAQFHQVRRGNMLVSITEGGHLRAASEISIISQVEGQARIIYLIPEGTEARRGDLLVELDSSELEENLTQRQIAYQNAFSSFTEANENFSIKRSETDSEIALAELKVEFAKVDQRKYLDGDFPQRKRNAEAAIQLAQEELTRAEDRLKFTEDLQEKGYATLAERQADKLTRTRRVLELERSREELRLLVEYEHPRRVRELESDLEQAIASLNRTRSRAVAQMSQAEATLNARKATLDLEQSRLARVQNQLEHTKIFSPSSGLVVYGTQGGGGGNQTPMEEGATVRQRQEIIKLPDLSRMVVEVKVHESQVSQVRRGQIAFVTIDSIPDRRFRGRVQRVAVLPDSQSRWMNPDLKVYTTEVLVEEDLPSINPGVSARAEIIVSQLEDVLHVPIQAVSTFRGDRVVYRHLAGRPEPIPVEVGMFNDNFVQIRSGLSEGERILLSPPRRALAEDFLPLMLGDDDPEGVAAARAAPVEASPAERGEPRPSAGEGRRPGAGRPEGQNLSTEERDELRRQRQARVQDGVAEAGPRRPAAGGD